MNIMESNIGDTPNGGVKSEAYFFNKDMQAVDKKLAEIIIIRELDKDGNLVFETFLRK